MHGRGDIGSGEERSHQRAEPARVGWGWRAAAAMAGAVVLVGLAAAGRAGRQEELMPGMGACTSRGCGEALTAGAMAQKHAAMLRLAAKAEGAKAVVAAGKGKVQLELRDIEQRLKGTIQQMAPAAKRMALDEETAPAGATDAASVPSAGASAAPAPVAAAAAPAAAASPAVAASPAANQVCRCPVPDGLAHECGAAVKHMFVAILVRGSAAGILLSAHFTPLCPFVPACACPCAERSSTSTGIGRRRMRGRAWGLRGDGAC